MSAHSAAITLQPSSVFLLEVSALWVQRKVLSVYGEGVSVVPLKPCGTVSVIKGWTNTGLTWGVRHDGEEG